MQKHNEYSKTFPALFEAIPKSVLAAVAASFATQGGDTIEQAGYRIAKEWEMLVQAGIVSQPLTVMAKATIEAGKARGYTQAFGGE